jgi:probable rRNA maturation factor
MAIRFFEEETPFKFSKRNTHKKWIGEIAKGEGKHISELVFIFCSDEYLHQINLSYLNHDTYTDIITFDHTELENTLEGEIYISIERVIENAAIVGETFQRELLRVMSHGVLHLCGYKDKTNQEANLMRKKEEEAIKLFEGVQ